ncbi:MAG: helix-turn-helix domain-containing protein [Candidatus Sedimenticola sp. (ex Thyasira tokunagai)]
MTKGKGPQDAGPKVSTDNSSAVQRQKLHRELQNRPGGMTTDQIRYELDILMPAARVHELRWGENLNIVTEWQRVETKPGRWHTLARYVLLPGIWKEGKK